MKRSSGRLWGSFWSSASGKGQFLGLLVIVTMGLLGGLLYRNIGFNTGVQFMGYYAAVLTVPALTKLITGS